MVISAMSCGMGVQKVTNFYHKSLLTDIKYKSQNGTNSMECEWFRTEVSSDMNKP